MEQQKNYLWYQKYRFDIIELNTTLKAISENIVTLLFLELLLVQVPLTQCHWDIAVKRRKVRVKGQDQVD